MQPRRRNDPRPFQVGDIVDIVVAKGWNPRGEKMRAEIEVDLWSESRGMFLVRFEDTGLKDKVHQIRFELVTAVEDSDA
jgi:hypothetical protein